MVNLMVMTKGLHKRYRTKGISTNCRKCEQPIEPGQPFISKPASVHTVLYHKVCWDSLFFEPKEEIEVTA